MKNSVENESQIFRNQKKYNFNCKDFFSAKNKIDFQSLRRLTVPLEIRLYQDKKNKAMEERKEAISSFSNSKRLDKVLEKRSKNADVIIREKREKSSVQIMREKMSHYYGIVSSARKRRESVESINKNANSREEEDDHIAEEENPFDNF